MSLKRQIRRKVLKARDSMNTREIEEKSTLITKRIAATEAFAKAKTIAAYAARTSEVRTIELIRLALSSGKRVFVPISDVARKRLLFSELLNPDRELGPGTFDIPEPKPKYRRIVRFEEADLALVPGVVWDLRGYRLGYGQGYYDRALAELTAHIPTIGLGFELQVVDSLPVNHHDMRVDQLATEKRLVECKGA